MNIYKKPENNSINEKLYSSVKTKDKYSYAVVNRKGKLYFFGLFCQTHRIFSFISTIFLFTHTKDIEVLDMSPTTKRKLNKENDQNEKLLYSDFNEPPYIDDSTVYENSSKYQSTNNRKLSYQTW